MFSPIIKLSLVSTAMAPVLVSFWLVKVIETGNIFSGWYFLLAVITLVIICLLILKIAKKKLEKLEVNITSAKSADHQVISFLFIYLLPVLDIVKKGELYIILFSLVIFLSLS